MTKGNHLTELRRAFPEADVSRKQIEFALLATCPELPEALSIGTGFLINHLDFDLLSSVHPQVFRNMLPSLLYGLTHFLEEQDNPVVYAVFKNLIDYPNVEFWDEKFIAKWADMTSEQYDLIEMCLNRCGPALGELNLNRAHSTLSALRQLSA
ncbi:hypothetical protein ACXYMP_16000 [Aliiroseovarius sp. CAU 1755]